MRTYGKSESGNPLTKYVNMHQTKEERREKYHYLKGLGFSVAYATQGRDFRWSTIQRNVDYFGNHPEEAAKLGLCLEV
jgi:hypothetical protein